MYSRKKKPLHNAVKIAQKGSIKLEMGINCAAILEALLTCKSTVLSECSVVKSIKQGSGEPP